MSAGAVVSDPQPASASHADPAGVADGGAAAFVLVVGRDVPDAGMQALGCTRRGAGELNPQDGGVSDVAQVRPVGLDVAKQALDPGLIGRGAGRERGWTTCQALRRVHDSTRTRCVRSAWFVHAQPFVSVNRWSVSEADVDD
jgi:hypothetical protein